MDGPAASTERTGLITCEHGIQGWVGAVSTHGHPDMRCRPRGGVIDAVAHHGEAATACLEGFDGRDLVGGRQRSGMVHHTNHSVTRTIVGLSWMFVPGAAPVEHPSNSTELPSEDQVKAAVTSFSMLAEPTRLRLLWLVSAEELDVSSLAARTQTSVSIVSAHLAKLRLAGLVDTRKSGRHVLYRARDTHVRKLIAEALFHADHQISGVVDHE